jgi:hypothetical protein
LGCGIDHRRPGDSDHRPMPVRPPKLPSAGVIPFAGSMKLRFHKTFAGSSASSA